jgi:hypothetical protein
VAPVRRVCALGVDGRTGSPKGRSHQAGLKAAARTGTGLNSGIFRLDSSYTFSLCSPSWSQATCFLEPQPTVPDEEVIETLRAAIARAGRLPRSADLLLCGLCARYLVEEMHGAGLDVVRASTVRDGR